MCECQCADVLALCTTVRVFHSTISVVNQLQRSLLAQRNLQDIVGAKIQERVAVLQGHIVQLRKWDFWDKKVSMGEGLELAKKITKTQCLWGTDEDTVTKLSRRMATETWKRREKGEGG